MIFCAESYEVVNVIKLAMDGDLPYTFLRDQGYTHPTLAESLNDLFSVKKMWDNHLASIFAVEFKN